VSAPAYRFVVVYGYDDDEHQYTHTIHCNRSDPEGALAEAKKSCDNWLAGNGWNGKPDCRVWVIAANAGFSGEVVYGTPPAVQS